MPAPPSDFTTPVELRSIQSADRTLVRFLPVLVLMAGGVLVLTLLILGLLMPGVPGVYYPASVALAVAVPTLMYVQKRRQLNDEYRLNKTLRLSPEGLRRTDGTTVVEISWHGVTRFQEEPVSFAANSKGPIVFPVTGVANAAKRAAHSTTALGLLGVGTVAPRPGATQRALQLHDERNGSRLQFGDVNNTDRALIFPSEFESDWRNGVIGSWLRHYRPDIRTLG
ncbi:hypothetical protein ACXPWS_26910 [Mycobacterium sp. BMJ-28]